MDNNILVNNPLQQTLNLTNQLNAIAQAISKIPTTATAGA